MSKLNKLEMLDSLFEKLASMPAQMQQASQQRPAGAKPYADSEFFRLISNLLSFLRIIA